MAAVMLVTVIAGCRKEDEYTRSMAEIPEFVYVPTYITLPDSITDISSLVYANDKLFLSSWLLLDETTYEYGIKLYSIEIDGTNLKELSNYSSGSPPEGAIGNAYLNSMLADGEGNLWVSESGNYYGFDIPEGVDVDMESGEQWQYYYDMGNVMTVRKLDETGAEIMSVDISSLAAGTDYFYVSTFNIDKDGNIYIGAEQTIYVLDNNGRLQFKLEISNWVDRLISLPDGTVAFSGYTDGGRVLRKIDFATRAWGEEMKLPMDAYNSFPGSGDYSIVYTNNMSLFGLETGTGEGVKLLSWLDSDINPDGLNNITMLADGRILCTSYRWNRSAEKANFELIILTKTLYETLPQKTILTLATVWLDWNLRNSIVDFNKSNETYRIQVIDYSEFNTEEDYSAGFTKLTTEIISGRIPDILDISNLPYAQYVARGLLQDLYTYIDADPDMDRSDYFESVFGAAEINGGLYQIFPTFNISTLVGHPNVLGPGIGWNMSEFQNVIRANPQADVPMGLGYTKSAFINYAVSLGMDEFVDWPAGKCNFNNDDFIQLLEFSGMFPTDYEWSENDPQPNELIATGRQIMTPMWVHDFRDLQYYVALFGGDLVFKGFPNEGRNGNTLNLYSGLAMTSVCPYKDGAWEFMRLILTEEWQDQIGWGFATNRASFNKRLEEEMTPNYYIDENGNEVEMSRGGMSWGDGPMIEFYALTQEEADKVLALIDSVSGVMGQNESLMNIINEGAADFFSGRSTAQDAARVIQSRASIYIAEQS